MGIIGCGYGSEWHLMLYLARRRAALTRLVEGRLGLSGLSWLDHQELRDRKSGALKIGEPRGLEFLAPDDPVREEWERLWPQSGNVHNWDAVGRAMSNDTGAWVLLEAKAHIGELNSTCAAISDESHKRIRGILEHTQQDLGIIGAPDWLSGYYQYCNRLALLQFLRERSVDARLLFVYFTGDRADLGSPGRICPRSETEWRSSIDQQKQHVGVSASAPLLRFVHELFLPVYRVPIRSADRGRDAQERER